MSTLQQKLEQAIQILHLELTTQQIKNLLDYITLLQKWNKVYNLTAITQADEILVKHIIDCLAAIKNVPFCVGDNINILDVGSGAGLPSIVWAIACPKWNIYSIDAVHKKIAFQQQAKIALKLNNIYPLHIRIQDLNLDSNKFNFNFDSFDIITARAYANSNEIIVQTKHLINKNGSYILLKGKDNEDINIQNSLIHKHKIIVPFLEGERHVFLIQFDERLK